MDQNTGNSASAAGLKKDKKSKKSNEEGDSKKKFVSVFLVWQNFCVKLWNNLEVGPSQVFFNKTVLTDGYRLFFLSNFTYSCELTTHL